MTGELDSFSIKNLEVRYGVARSNIYNRINGLKDLGYNLEPESREGKSIYNADQVVLMDALDRHIKNGGNIKNFPPPDPTKKDYIGQDNSQLSYRTQDTEQLNPVLSLWENATAQRVMELYFPVFGYKF
ncbi:hypothetical protein [Nostoc sp. CALU 546]|uniref:hypothetical protein n=1 Tax=Nostoc sp. CALU 546 TaxID=1867241 RepID=UPI003B682127